MEYSWPLTIPSLIAKLTHLFALISVGIFAFNAGVKDALNVGVAVLCEVAVAVDAAGEVLVVFVVFPVHPATNTVANRIVIINTINNCFFIVIASFWRFFPVVRGSFQK